MKKLLCLIGLHAWKYDGKYKRTCRRCPEWQFKHPDGFWVHDILGTEHRAYEQQKAGQP